MAKRVPSPAETLIRSHHATLDTKWDRGKVAHFCQELNITLEELAAYVNEDAGKMFRYYEKDKFPGPVCLLLDLFENQYIHRKHNLPLRPIPTPVT